MLTVSVIGLGNRGYEYMCFIKYLYPSLGKITAVCDISAQALSDLGPRFKIADERRFLSADRFFARGVLSDALIIATQDKSHFEIAKKALLTGYKYILLEKPVSDSVAECEVLKKLAQENKSELVVCHVLRYSKYYKKISKILNSGVMGELVHINHTENVGYFHFAHSYVRGNWKLREESSPSILAKCCHDLDLLYGFAGSPCQEISSLGGLNYFNLSHAPEGATEFCLGGCKVKKDCPYDAEYTYLTSPPHKSTFVKHNSRTMTGKLNANRKDMYLCLKNTSYGKCVFLNDNDVCDFQTVNIRFKNGVTAALTMSAFSAKCKRASHFVGTKGELICDDKDMTLNIFGKGSKKIRAANRLLPQHSEGDFLTVKSFLLLASNKWTDKSVVTSIAQTIESHKMAIAAEYSRLNGGKSVKFD